MVKEGKRDYVRLMIRGIRQSFTTNFGAEDGTDVLCPRWNLVIVAMVAWIAEDDVAGCVWGEARLWK
jgi:hypothetical protein